MKNTKRSFLTSAVSLLLCIVMLAGTTFAWFTDSAVSKDNVIESGNLNADMFWSDSYDGLWHDAESGAVFTHDNWEPGYTEVKYIRVENNGNLNFKWKISIEAEGEVSDLSDVIDVYYVNPVSGNIASLDGLDSAGSLTDVLGSRLTTSGRLAKDEHVILAVAFHMDENAGNEYKNTSLCDEGFSLKLVATQDVGESDSFDDQYDKDAEWPNNVVLGNTATSDVTTDNNGVLTTPVDMESDDKRINAHLPAGVQLENGTNKVMLNVANVEDSKANITLDENEEKLAIDVHVLGVSKSNTTVMAITVKELLPKGLNMGNYRFYHVENGQTVEMTLLADGKTPVHNNYEYDPATGDVVLHLASFSEVALVAEPSKWEGNFDYSWYTNAVAPLDGEATVDYTIANADQLAAFGAIVGGMAEGIERDSFKGKNVKLLADIDLGDKNNANESLIFHPIGYYYTDDKNADGTTGDYYSTVYSFEGTFDGNGNTIANFYQNTWEIKGDYDGNYYKDAMGLFGYVYCGTVKNLTVDNFSSDGEFTPTGVIAAYAIDSTFENIAITNCNPRVYNTGNGGIVGIGGNSDDPDTYKLTFTNITIDNSNKITALWGSWDVACGGLVGMFRGAGHVYMTNCHVAAQIDVYNDVCGNYQYYWYRYSGMMIGTNKNMTTDANGYTVPETSKFHADGCTVHFGNWNDYYYCELVANSLASYTHDHQFSRLTEIKSLDEIKSGDTWTKTGNFLLTSGDTKTCYHIVKNADGTLKQHLHTDAGEETVKGETVLKEDKQIVYLPFNQLFTGYGWGVKHIPVYNGENYAFKGITILDREVADSVEKFEGKVNELANNKTYKLGDIFTFVDKGVKLVPGALTVSIANKAENNPVSATIVYDRDNWENSTITFTGTGEITITIQDYYFCTPTTIDVTITDRQPEEKFDVVMNNGDFLHRVGNSGTVALDKLFKAKDGVSVGTISVTIEALNGTSASGTYSNNAIQFNGTGVVKVTIKDDDSYCIPTVLYLEVVEATNVIGLSGEISGNVVLLNDCGLSSLTVSGRNAVYGNGFTATYTGNGQYLNSGLKYGVITVSENGTLDNLRVVASIYPASYLYYDEVKAGPSSTEGDKTRYHYQLSAVVAKGNATISNCYIYGGRNNIFVDAGNVSIEDTILECGTLANIQIQSNSSHTVTLNNVTTIQHRVNATIGDTSAVMMGAGIVVGPDTSSNPTIVLNGNLKQYNWVTAADKEAISNSTGKTIIQTALDATAFNHTVNGATSSNLGIVYMNRFEAVVDNNTGLPYEFENVKIPPAEGMVYSLKGASESQIYSDYANADRSTVNGLYKPQFKYPTDLGGQYIENTTDCDEFLYRDGDTIYVMFVSGGSKTIDLASLVNITKYSGQNLSLDIAVKDENGNAVAITNGKLTLSTAGTYTVTYAVTDTMFYDKDGKAVSQTINYSWDVTISVSLKDKSIPNAYFEFDSTKQIMGYGTKGILEGGLGKNNFQYIPFLAGLKIYDYNGQNSYLRFDGNTDFSKIAKAELTCSSDNAYITITLTDGGVIHVEFFGRADSGSSTKTGTLTTSNNTIYYLTDGDTSATTTTWKINSYSFTGNNGVTIENTEQKFSNCVSGTLPTSSFGTTIKYTVTYDANGGDCGQTLGYATSASAAVTLPTPTRSGYTFMGWYTAIGTNGTRVGGAGDSYTPSANVTLYAVWGAPCTVTYDANGGSCGTPSERFDGKTLILPNATKDGYVLYGWFTSPTGGTKVGNAGDSYNPSADITLYAQWGVEYTVNYKINGGEGSDSSATYTGTDLILPTPTRTGYKFLGWYTAASGGTYVGGAGASYKPEASITLYAQWERISYTITTTPGNNATVTLDKTTAYYGDTVSVTVTFSKNNSKTLTVKDASGNTILSKNAAGTYTFTMPASNVTITASSKAAACVTGDTLVTLADGTQKELQHTSPDDMFLVWDFYTGTYTVAPALFLFDVRHEEVDVIYLNFDDGTTIKVVDAHGFFSAVENRFVFIGEDNASDYVGHDFVKLDGDSYTTTKLVSYEIVYEYADVYSILTDNHFNAILEGMLTLTAPHISENFFAPFEVSDNLMYDHEVMEEDIAKYGLYEYELFEDYLTYEQFVGMNIDKLKVAVGKGLLTFDEIIETLELLNQFI